MASQHAAWPAGRWLAGRPAGWPAGGRPAGRPVGRPADRSYVNPGFGMRAAKRGRSEK